MKVKQLIKELKKMPQNSDVWMYQYAFPHIEPDNQIRKYGVRKTRDGAKYLRVTYPNVIEGKLK